MYLIAMIVLFSVLSCDYFRVITSVNHKNSIVSADDVITYLKKGNLDILPVFGLDTSFYYTNMWWPGRCIFNKEGNYLLIDTVFASEQEVCFDENRLLNTLEDILINGEGQYISNSLAIEVFVLTDSSEMPVRKIRTYQMNLDDMSPYLRTLEGNKLDINNFFSDYLVFYQFNLSGRSKLTRIVIKEEVERIEKLNQKYNDKFQVALLCLDRMDWMYE